MIVFDGYVSGEAEKRYLEWMRTVEQNVLLLGAISAAPFLALLHIKTGLWIVWILLAVMLAIIPLMVRIIPKSQKEKRSVCPKTIIVDGDRIVFTSEKVEKELRTADVKEVLDCKEYYELLFAFGKGRFVKCICQKDLLAKGTLQEFEALFAGKITDLSSDFD